MWQDIDTHAELLDLRCRLKDGARNAELMERQCQGQPTDSASRDQNVLVKRLNLALDFRAARRWPMILAHRDFPSLPGLPSCCGLAATGVSRKLIAIRL